jgi:hypothetical protein
MATDHTGTEFEFSAEQIEHDREKSLAGPLSTGFSMSTAAKTTPRTRLKLKKAQEQIMESHKEIEKLRLGLARHAALNPPESSLDTPASSKNNSMTEAVSSKNDSIIEADEVTQKDIMTESQAIGAAIFRKKEMVHADSDAMEEDENASFTLGNSSSEGHPSDSSKTPPKRLERNAEASKDKVIIAVGSSQSSSSSESSSSSSSSSSNESSGSGDTQELAKKLSTLPKSPLLSQPKHLAQTDELSDSFKDPADSQDLGSKSGSRRAHLTSDDPQGIAGGLSEDAGHSV